MGDLGVIIATIVGKVASYTIGPIVRPIARRCPLKYLWEYKSNLQNLNTKIDNLEAQEERVRGFTNVGVEPLPDINDWLVNATNIIREVSVLISKDNPERRCCEGCTYSNLKESYQHRKDVACKLKDVDQLLQKASRSIRSWKYESNLENLKNEVKKLEARRENVQLLIKDGEEPLRHVRVWQESVASIINEISRLVNENNPDHQNNVAGKLKVVAQLLQEAGEFREVSIMSEETVYKINLENLKKEKEKLEAKRESLKCSIKAGEEPLPDVKLWQDKVNSIINEASRLTSQHNHQQQNNVTRMLIEVAQLLQEFREFTKLSFRPIPEETWLQSSEVYKAFESRTSILKEIVEALSKPDVGLVGIYGMGGIGKTTLAKQVARQAIQDEVCNKIVFVEVSQTPNMKKIQGEIGSKLGLKFREEDEESERARGLYQQLKNEETTLLILDNVWESLDFETMGIPYKHDSKGLKLLMTARKDNVLTDGIESSQHKFSIEALEWDDAWSLFKSKAGTSVDRRDLLSVAVDVAKECGGVPLAIVTIAKALNNKETYEWETVLLELRSPSPHNFDGIAANVYKSIELSYNYLETEELKATFLLCSSMGSTYDPSIEDLLRYGIGLGLFNRFNTMEAERNNVRLLINALKASSLLVDAPKSEGYIFPYMERFAMHDVVCDVARSIARKDKNVFTVIDDVIPRSWESDNMLKNCTSITLDGVKELSKDLQLECLQLKFLYVKPKSTYSEISDKFFACMPRLQVLHLIRMNLQPLSTPFSGLTNLQTLCLEACWLKDKVDIGDLKNLEILSVRCDDQCFELPEKLHQLTKLRLLELDCLNLRSIPSKFILSFKKLEALYMRRTTIEWEAEKSNNGTRDTSRDVLEHLSNLTSLEICVPEAIMLRGLLSPKLERYNITIGRLSLEDKRWDDGDFWDIQCKTSRFLQVKLKTNEDGIFSGLKAIRQLVLDEVPGIANNFCGLDRMGFPELEDLKVQNNSHILHIVDMTSCDSIFPILKSLILWNLINLKMICNGPLAVELFHQLRTIKVGKCNELTNIFSLASDRVFQELEEIEVVCCEMLKEVFAISEQVHEIKFGKLRILRLISLPQFESLCCNVKTTTPILQLTSDTKPREIILEEEQDVPKPLFNEKVVVTNLETLKIGNININSIWDNQLPTMANIPNLTCLIISNLANLRRLGSGDYIKFPLLREITIRRCPKFKEIIFDDKVGVPSLEKINIFDMGNLKMIWHNQLVEDSFPKLKWLQVEGCPKLLTLFRSNMCGRFLSLKTLSVRICHSLEEIFDLQGVNSEESHPTTSTQSAELCTDRSLVLSFANLQNLTVKSCRSLKTIIAKEEVEAKEAPRTATFVFPKLTSLELYQLPKLRTFYLGRNTTEWPVLKTWTMYQHRIPMSEVIFHRGDDLLSFSSNEDGFEFEVQKFWPSLLSIMSSWVENLTRLILYGCGDLEDLFPYSMAVTEELREKKTENTMVFPKLKYLEMRQLANLKGLCYRCHIKFPILKEFQISGCPELTAFIFDDKVGVPSLEKINIRSMHNLKMIWHNQLVEDSFPKLKLLRVENCQKLSTLFGSNMCGRFLSLETLDVSNCGSLKELVLDLREINSEERHPTTSTQSGELCTNSFLDLHFANLQNLKVSYCQSLKTIVAREEVEAKEAPRIARFVFLKLTSLVLYELPELRTFYLGRYTTEWPILKTLMIYQHGIFPVQECHSGMPPSSFVPQKVGFEFRVQKIWPSLLSIMSSWVENLTTLTLCGCDDLEELFPYSMVVTEESREKKTENTMVFPKLNYLEMKQLANLKGLCSRCHIEFPILKEFQISDCPELTAFIFDDKVKVSNLKKVKISSMDKLTKIWDKQLAGNSIPKLESLQAYGCQKLLTLLPFDMCESFSSLEILNVSDCGSLEKIFYLHEINSEERHSTTSTQSKELYPTVLSFANLKDLKVSKCGSLKFLFSVSNVAKNGGAAEETHATAKFVFPELISLALDNLPELRTFCPARYTMNWPVLRRLGLWDCGMFDTDDEDQMQNSLFLVEKAFPCLKKLILAGKDLMMMWQGQDPEPLLRNFKILQVFDESRAGNQFQEPGYWFSSQAGNQLQAHKPGYWVQAHEPVLQYIGNVKYMWKQNFKLDLTLPNFEEIEVFECDSFISLMPPSASFQNLTSLAVYGCHSLEHIGTFSMAKNLVKLVSLRIHGCKKIVEVLRNHGDVSGDKILFSNLKCLILCYLPSLTSFCSSNFTLEFPSLEELDVDNCPNMKIFCLGELTTPKLHGVKNFRRSIELSPDVDFSTAIQQLHEQEQTGE